APPPLGMARAEIQLPFQAHCRGGQRGWPCGAGGGEASPQRDGGPGPREQAPGTAPSTAAGASQPSAPPRALLGTP
ncbi:unnamed protein product, partial [Bubo scandiacus]